MRTEDLIRAMAADTQRPNPVGQVLSAALALTALAAGVVFYSATDVRSDLSAALTQPPVMLKHVFPVLIAIAALGAVLTLARPEGRLGSWRPALLPAPALVAAAFAVTAARTPMPAWGTAVMGSTAAECLSLIIVISLPILAGTLWALRRGASTRPRVAGAMAGLLSASTGAAIFAFHCIEDSPMFYGTWYVLAIALVTLLGTLLGPRTLRW